MHIRLEVAEAVQLAHALVAWTAARADIRALLIKGPVPAYYGLRDPRPSADVDVLVDPQHAETLAELFREQGWHNRPSFNRPRAIRLHSTTLIHDDWPCDLDVHHMYPGFLEEDQAVFDRLWQGRQRLIIAATSVFCPSVVATAAIQVLHALRDYDQPRNQHEYAQCLTALRKLDAPKLQTDLSALADATGSWDTLRPLLSELGVQDSGRRPTHPRYQAELTNWRLRSSPQTNNETTTLLITLSRSKGFERTRLAWSLIFPSEAQFRENHPALKEGRRHYYSGLLLRLARGVTRLPQALKKTSSYRTTFRSRD